MSFTKNALKLTALACLIATAPQIKKWWQNLDKQ